MDYLILISPCTVITQMFCLKLVVFFMSCLKILLNSPIMPVITQPIFSVILNMCVTVAASNNLSYDKKYKMYYKSTS